MFELTKQFRFDAAHTLERRIDTEPSRRIHGHSYRATVTVRGEPDPRTGMIIDLGLFERALAEARDGLDHRLLDEVPDLGPATLENLSAWIWRRLAGRCPGLATVTVYRDSEGDSCACYGLGAELHLSVSG
jgi:6-pyruvoyltetrahydropterin/6-carboxytetrahydropterin synthase